MSAPQPTEPVGFDEYGWLVASALPLLPALACFSVFAPEPDSNFDGPRWDHAARRFFGVSLTISPPKSYPSGTAPLVDAATLAVTVLGAAAALATVRVTTLPIERAPGLRIAAERAVAEMGGAGFDVLLRRARRLWQIECSATAPHAAKVAAVAVAAVLANVTLGPILPPEGRAMFGVKGARLRLEALKPW
ncbi:MAG: hypothetical protein EXR75_13000 [Myxococcales bacterium]|nr:hypothetical protein [Myxococcales bacterium]